MLLPRVNTKLHVGVVLGDNLKWSEHIERVLKRVAGPVHLCKQLAYNHRLPSPVIRRFYVAYIRPRMEYCSAVWGGCSQTLLARLERVQLQLVRALFHAYRNLPKSELLRMAGLPTLGWRRREHHLLMLWKFVHHLGPPQLELRLPKPVSTRAALNLRRGHSIEFPGSTSARHLSSFLCVSIPDWNNLPSFVVDCQSVPVFRGNLRAHFVDDKYSFGL